MKLDAPMNSGFDSAMQAAQRRRQAERRVVNSLGTRGYLMITTAHFAWGHR